MDALQRWLERQSDGTAQLWALLGVVVVGYLQYLSGPDLVFSIFYVLPLLLLGSKVGGRAAMPMCAVAAIMAAFADFAFDPGRQDLWVVFWNAASRFAVFSLVASLRAGVDRQERLAGTDSLTGVANGRAFDEAAERAIAAFAGTGRPLSICYADVDDFKEINDSFGHSGGDAALKAIAAALLASTRDTDVVARLGGDEFALLLPETSSEGTCRLLESLKGRVDEAAAGLPSDVSFSVGAATFLVEPASVDEMIGAADAMMYAAKRAGKATFQHVTVGKDSPDAVPDRGATREPLRAGG